VTAILVRIDVEGGPPTMIDPDGRAHGLEDFLLEPITDDSVSMRQSHRRFVEPGGRTCSDCGARSILGDVYCGQCGTRI
jgi:hypothetical protein